MKVTRFAQSCLLIETKEKRILIDPGYIEFKETYLENEWKDIDIILISHKHKDHCHEEAVAKLVKNPDTKLYSSKEVAEHYKNLDFQIIEEGDLIELGEIKVEAVLAVHGYIPWLKGGNEVHENIGFIIDDGERRLYQTSDTISFANDYKCDAIFLPVNNHGLVMGPFDAAVFAKETEASLIVPIHYDNAKFPADMEKVKEEFEKQEISYKILGIGEQIEI